MLSQLQNILENMQAGLMQQGLSENDQAMARMIEQPKRQQKGTLTNDEVRRLIEVAAEVVAVDDDQVGGRGRAARRGGLAHARIIP